MAKWYATCLVYRIKLVELIDMENIETRFSPRPGKIRMAGAPVGLSATAGTIRTAAAPLGEHYDKRLREMLGMCEEEIESPRVAGAFAATD